MNKYIVLQNIYGGWILYIIILYILYNITFILKN